MDGSEIVRHIPEIARGAGAVAAAMPFHRDSQADARACRRRTGGDVARP